MAYPFFTAGSVLNNKTQKENYTDLVQETINQQFYNATDWYTIYEETSSGNYEQIDVRINGLINPTTGQNIEDDYKKILFRDITHSVDLGRHYQFQDNFWLTINVDKVNTLVSSVVVKRCNNTLRWMDDEGAYHEIPCSMSYLIKENRDYATAGSVTVVPSGMIDVLVQFNEHSNKIKANQRFLIGNQNNWTAYRVEGGGINNFDNTKTLGKESVGIIRYSMAVDYVNRETDDVINGIANSLEYNYEILLNPDTIYGSATDTFELSAIVTLNETVVNRDLIWSSSNNEIATVDEDGVVTFIANGLAVITCTLKDNSLVFDTCNVDVNDTPVINYQVLFSPSNNDVLEGSEKIWSAYLYENGVQQVDAASFVLDSNTVPSTNYIYTVDGSNQFTIKNFKMFLTDVLEVTATIDGHSKTIAIQLRGKW